MLRLLDTRRPRLLLTLFCLLLWTPGFFTLPPGDRDESRFAQATKQMLETDNFVRIQNGAEARNQKPIGIYWMQAPFAAIAHAAGLATANPIWPYRLPSAIGALIGVLAAFALGERLVGRRAALLGAAFLAASVVLTTEVHIAKTDAALFGSVTVAMSVLARAYLEPRPMPRWQAALFWLALAVSILLKGPIGPMVAGLTALSLSLADRRGRWLLSLRPGWGVPLMVACVLPWFVAIGLATHGKFFADAVGGDLGRKLSSGDDAHGGPPGLHLLLLPVLVLPAAAALPGALRAGWRDRHEAAPRFLLAWIVPSWIVFEAAPTKLPHYTLPLQAAVCLLAAWFVLRPDRRAIGRLSALLPIIVALALAGALGAAPVFLHLPIAIGAPSVLAAILIAACFTPLLRRPDEGRLSVEHRAFFAALICMPLFYGAVLGWEIPNLPPLWIAPRVVAALPPGRLGSVGFAEPSLMFLGGTGTEWLKAEEGVAALASGEISSLLVGDRDWPSARAALLASGIVPEPIATIDGFNYSRGRFVTLRLLTNERKKIP